MKCYRILQNLSKKFSSRANRKFMPQAFGDKSRIELLADAAEEEAL